MILNNICFVYNLVSLVSHTTMLINVNYIFLYTVEMYIIKNSITSQ
jgi:hypothetical protein